MEPSQLPAVSDTSTTPPATSQEASIVEEENVILRQQHLALKKMLEKENEQNGRNRRRMEKLSAVLQEKDKLITQLQQNYYGLKKSSEKTDQLESVLENEREALQKQQEENKKLILSLEEGQQHAKQLQRVIHFLREKSDEAHLEVKQLKEELQASQGEIAALSQQNNSSKAEAAASLQQLEHKELSLKEAQEEISTLQQQFEHLKTAVSSAQQQLCASEHSHNTIAQQEERLRHENRALRDRMKDILSRYHTTKECNDRLKISSEEHEKSEKIAQQHLAKKLKEAALQTEKIEEQQILIATLQTALTGCHEQLESTKSHYESQLKQEQSLHEQLQNNLKIVEASVIEWENKYAQLNYRYQEIEKQNQGLKAIEEKQIQLQGLLNHVGRLMGNASSPRSSIQQPISTSYHVKSTPGTALGGDTLPTIGESVPQATHENHSSQPVPTGEPHPLFDIPDSFVRYKQTLFD